MDRPWIRGLVNYLNYILVLNWVVSVVVVVLVAPMICETFEMLTYPTC